MFFKEKETNRAAKETVKIWYEDGRKFYLNEVDFYLEGEQKTALEVVNILKEALKENSKKSGHTLFVLDTAVISLKDIRAVWIVRE